MFSSILTGGLNGMEAYLLRAEVDISHGLPSFCMVGSLSNEVREAKERIQVALKNAGFVLSDKWNQKLAKSIRKNIYIQYLDFYIKFLISELII